MKIMDERFNEIEYLRNIVEKSADTKECKALKKLFNETLKTFTKDKWPQQLTMEASQAQSISKLKDWYEGRLSEMQTHYENLMQTHQTFESEGIQREKEVCETQIAKMRQRF